ncbi:MAG: type II toxin-antitoxin system VapC family toxin [Anaerolineae bacterium]|jgi:predicted nucleic acid-binding protein|nr:type II toxin-antitoxin system VapC family toxin [Anaerolineae bacterium]
MKLYYFDTNALYKHYYADEERGAPFVKHLVKVSQHPILISTLTETEYLVCLLKAMRDKKLQPNQVKRLFERHLTDVSEKNDPLIQRSFLRVPLQPDYYWQARELLMHYGGISIGTLDALHLALVKHLNIHFEMCMVTSDQGVLRVCKDLKIATLNPEEYN